MPEPPSRDDDTDELAGGAPSDPTRVASPGRRFAHVLPLPDQHAAPVLHDTGEPGEISALGGPALGDGSLDLESSLGGLRSDVTPIGDLAASLRADADLEPDLTCEGHTYRDTVASLAPDGLPIEPPLAIFASLSDDVLSELSARMRVRQASTGDVLVREGDPGDACYIIQEGSVRVLKREAGRAEPVEVVRLGPGALFGEFALLADRRRHATVQAVEPCRLFEITRDLLAELSATYPDVGPALERIYRERLVSTLLTTARFFTPLPDEERGALMARFSRRFVEPGEVIVREGEPSGGLSLIVLGEVEITKRDRGRVVTLATLGEGSYFGEMSLLLGGLATATATALGRVELAQLAASDFYHSVAAYPALWSELRREAERRREATQSLLLGDAPMA